MDICQTLKMEQEFIKKILKENEEGTNSVMMVMRIFLERTKVQQNEVGEIMLSCLC